MLFHCIPHLYNDVLETTQNHDTVDADEKQEGLGRVPFPLFSDETLGKGNGEGGSLVPRPHIVLQVMSSWAGPGTEAKIVEWAGLEMDHVDPIMQCVVDRSTSFLIHQRSVIFSEQRLNFLLVY